tara:strand:+ start:894 stop:1487 length:594 start_codon:yes stop_codon:yes gene_type:complete
MKLELIVPNSWNDVSIKRFQEFNKVNELDIPEKQKLIKIISSLCDIEEEQIAKLRMKDLKEVVAEINKLERDSAEKGSLKKIVDFKGKKYGFIPNMSEMTTGEYIDLESTCTADAMNNLHTIMAILYRPLVGKPTKQGQYEIEPYEPTEQKEMEMLDFPMDYSLSAVNFFFRLGLALMSDLNKSMKTMREKHQLKVQ